MLIMTEEFYQFLPKFLFIIEGIFVTLQYSVVAVVFGLILGTILAIFKVSGRKFLCLGAAIYTSLFRGTPIIVQISLIYFGLPGLVGIKLSVFSAGALALSLNSGAYVSEIIRAGILAVDKGQFEAAKALGIPPYLAMKDIILPQAARNILPALINELINLTKESALVSTIGAMDLMRRAQVVSAETYDFFTPMLICAFCYYILVMIISMIGKKLERGFN